MRSSVRLVAWIAIGFELVGVLDLLYLSAACEPDEVWYDICEMVEPMERKERLIPPESELQAIAEERDYGR